MLNMGDAYDGKQNEPRTDPCGKSVSKQCFSDRLLVTKTDCVQAAKYDFSQVTVLPMTP